MRVLRTLATTIALLCAGPAFTSAQQLDEVVSWMPDLVLEETADTYIAGLGLRPDPVGGWIGWDTQLNQVRLYAENGSLRAFFGQEGSGPGEFRGVSSVARLDDGRLITLDRQGRISAWDADGSAVLADFNISVRRAFGMLAGTGDTVIVAGLSIPTDGVPSTKFLHLVSLEAEAIIESLFEIPVAEQDFRLVGSIQSPPPSQTSAGLAVAFSIYDSIWFTQPHSGAAVQRIDIPTTLLDGLRTDRPAFENTQSLSEWVREQAFTGHVFERKNGGWLVQVWGFDGEPWSALAALRADGSLEWEVERCPILMWYDTNSGLGYFWDPNGMEPGRLRVGSVG